MKWRLIIYGSLFLAGVIIIYSKSNYRKLLLTDRIYEELQHPEWSTRVAREKTILPSLGSGNQKTLYLVDVRRVSIPLNEAIHYYDSESDRLGFREYSVDYPSKAKQKFKREWHEIGLEIPSGDDVIVISQRISSDSTLRRHQPAK